MYFSSFPFHDLFFFFLNIVWVCMYSKNSLRLILLQLLIITYHYDIVSAKQFTCGVLEMYMVKITSFPGISKQDC